MNGILLAVILTLVWFSISSKIIEPLALKEKLPRNSSLYLLVLFAVLYIISLVFII